MTEPSPALIDAGRNLANARKALAVAIKHARTEARVAHANGTPQTVIAKTLDVDRARTLRIWLGK